MGEYIRRAKTAGLSWPSPEKVDERALEGRLFPIAAVSAPEEERTITKGPAGAVGREKLCVLSTPARSSSVFRCMATSARHLRTSSRTPSRFPGSVSVEHRTDLGHRRHRLRCLEVEPSRLASVGIHLAPHRGGGVHDVRMPVARIVHPLRLVDDGVSRTSAGAQGSFSPRVQGAPLHVQRQVTREYVHDPSLHNCLPGPEHSGSLRQSLTLAGFSIGDPSPGCLQPRHAGVTIFGVRRSLLDLFGFPASRFLLPVQRPWSCDLMRHVRRNPSFFPQC